MNIATMISKLQALQDRLGPDAIVKITDGYDCHFYSGDFEIVEFEGTVDIGVGGCKEDE